MSDRTPEQSEPFRTERALTAQRLAQYVARGRCERHLRFALFPSEAQSLLSRYGLEIEPLSPLLSGAGQAFERERVEELRRRAPVRDLSGETSEAFVSELRSQAEGRAFYYQPTMRGRIGAWDCEGRADLVEVIREGQTVRATVIDFKASARETVGFRLQVAFYVRLLAETLGGAGLSAQEIGGAIAARDSVLNEDGGWETFDLALYEDEIERLVSARDSDVARAAGAGEGRAVYHLRAACDGCPYNALCFADTAERFDLSLVPLITAPEKRALHAAGITSARELAALLEYRAGGAMVAAAGREAALGRASARWPLASRLPLLVQRARAAVRRYDRTVEAKRYFTNSDYGSLPDPAQYPDLVRIFVDAQRDYLKDKLYLVAARVVGPGGASEVIEMTDAPPDEESERALLVRFVQNLLPEVARAAGSTHAPLHVYTFAPRGERALLDALARHFDALCAVPAFYDLLTSHPALTQPMVSLLAEEVRARLNLSPVCQNLYEVSRELGFQWTDGETDFRRRFRARAFDNRRTFRRDPTTGMFGAPDTSVGAGLVPARVPSSPSGQGQALPLQTYGASDETDEAEDVPAPFVRIESAARFGAEVPLEYAYAAWGLLRESEGSKERARAQVRGFTGVTTEQIRALAAHRTRAMQHVEEAFAYKNRKVHKEPLDLSRLDRVEVEPEEVPLKRSLEDFLLLEHHASFQERLLHLSLPPRERAETGRTAVLRCDALREE